MNHRHLSQFDQVRRLQLFVPVSLLLILILLGGFISDVKAADWSDVEKIVATIELPKIPTGEADIRNFGASPGAAKNILPAINKAIAHLVKSGGGKVVIPAGLWHVKGPIHLKSKINLHLQDGARILFVGEVSDYLPVVKQRWEGTEVYSYSPMIYASNVEDVAITGKGEIDGNVNSPFHAWHKLQNEDISKLRKMGFSGVPVAQRVFAEGTYLRPGLIQIFGGKRILLEGFTALNSPFWVNHVVAASHVTVRNILVDSHFPNNDGIDIESSEYVLVENNVFKTGDDSVVIKSGRDLDGRTIGLPSRKIVVRNNEMGGEDGIGMGSEMSGGISDVFITDNIMHSGDSAFRFKANLDRGGTVERIYVRNFVIDRFKHLFWFQLNYPSEHGGEFETIYKNIEFSNIAAKKVETAFFIRGTHQFPLKNVLFKNINISETENTFDIQNALDLEFEDVTIEGQRIKGIMSWLDESASH
ncbi:glycoside hydrolase family 28 protein [Paraglaciecola aquimarina]|uniref:Glycoside hydrolase family 28 protein n=1 Tax=Paraglaciecola algarum TaxID=3050085 RepID=A0ABS9D2R2_9ALTE|nr:glycoside hydrolase family 28 protein [Paraglaciecola sp. G1-23]MCF2946725.1 glycoside hydrolase family 28 protein [Paraglaciecola sp. G1-23]